MMSEKKFKLMIFGNGGVGKTTLVSRYLTGLFTLGSMTIGVDFHIKQVDVSGKKITLQIWDFAGEERFRFLLPSYVAGANGAIFMFDITRYTSLTNLNEWLEVFKKGFKDNEIGIPMIMVGSKLDLEADRSVDKQYAEKIALKNKFKLYIECSSKTGENVEEIFDKIAYLMMEKDGLL